MRRGKEKGGGRRRGNLKQAPHFSAPSLMPGLIPRPWDHDLSLNQEVDTQLLSHPGGQVILDVSSFILNDLLMLETLNFSSSFCLAGWRNRGREGSDLPRMSAVGSLGHSGFPPLSSKLFSLYHVLFKRLFYLRTSEIFVYIKE